MIELAKLSILDWMMMGMVVIGYLFIVVKAAEWFIGLIIRKCHRFIIRNDRKRVAVEEFFDAFQFDEKFITTAKTQGGWVITVKKEHP